MAKFSKVLGWTVRSVAEYTGGFDWTGFETESIGGLTRPLVAIKSKAGFLGCAYFSVAAMDKIGEAGAIVSGVNTPEDMLGASIIGVSNKGWELGIRLGMRGSEALELFRAPTSKL
jgi:uncharacterized protein YunC (DUF1805 family)